MSSNTQHRIMLAGGGTAGHVNPLLAVADAIRCLDPDADIIALGTAVGLEADREGAVPPQTQPCGVGIPPQMEG